MQCQLPGPLQPLLPPPGLTPRQIRDADIGRRLDGRFVTRMFKVHNIDTAFWGVVQFRGPAAGNTPFRIYYEDNDIEDVSLDKLQSFLLPADTIWPSTRPRPTVTHIHTRAT